MKRVARPGVVAVAVGVLAAWSTSAFAQDTTVITPTPAPVSPPVVVQQPAAPSIYSPPHAETVVQEESVPNTGSS